MKNLKSFNQFVNEVRTTPVSGTKAGWTYDLDHGKYEIQKDVKGARIGDFVNVVLPKGTIISNLPGGVFAFHKGIKQRYTTDYGNGPKWHDKLGVSIIRDQKTLNQIEKNSKILENINEGKGFAQDKPNEFAYLDFKKWAYKNRGQLKKDILKARNTKEIWDTITNWWSKWVVNSGNDQWGYITNNQTFGRELALMMKSDDLIFDKQGNKITKLK